MDVDLVVKTAYAKRKALGLVVSYDRPDAEAQTKYGRATAAFASIQERKEQMDRFAWLGLNPRIEQ